MRRYLISLSSVVVLVLNLPAADWPCWRGPNGAGVSEEKSLPVSWSRENNIVWKTDLPGKGWSSPIIVGERVYLTAQMPDQELRVLAIERRRGGIEWDREVGRGKLRSHDLHNMATPTAVSDGEFVWAMFGTGDLVCLNREGTVLWRRNLVKEFGEYKTNHGYGSSPMLHDGRLYVACMHQGPSYLIAMDPKTGKTLWKRDRNLDAKEEAQDSYSSPIFVRVEGATQVVLAGAETVTAYEPATGEPIWHCGGLTVPHPYGRTIAGPTAADDMVVAVASGFQNRGYTVGIRANGRGNVTASHKSWTSSKFSADCPTPLVYRGKLYSIRDDGMASCLDLHTGDAHWQERLFSANVKVSPVAGDGKVYFLNGQGNCTVVKADTKLTVLATNSLDSVTLSTPAISGGQIFLRTEGRLWCAGTR